MNELDNVKELFDIFVDSCEKAGVKFSTKEEKQVEDWPVSNSRYWFRNSSGYVENQHFAPQHKPDNWRINNILIFRTEESCEKYYSIIDTINNIVDELGRPTWEDFEKIDSIVYACGVLTKPFKIVKATQSLASIHDGFFPSCKKPYLESLLEKVSEEDLLWAFKKSMRLESC